MKKINVLIIGSDARAHALAWKAMQSRRVNIVYVAPGNPGTAMLGCKNIPLAPVYENFGILADLACHLGIGLAIVGPENALAEGIVPAFKNRGIPTFGPEFSSIIEYSKSWAKIFMEEVGIPTAPAGIFTDPEAAKKFVRKVVREKGVNVVVKADGLAMGKGVRVCGSVAEADEAIEDFLVKKVVGKAGEKIVIEDRLEGVELSVHALCDGENVKLFPPVRDHKRLLDGNKGPMTGGMGVFGPIDVGAGLMKRIEEEIVLPCVRELAARKLPFVGCLYPGLMLTPDGPMVLEFNARCGDPEAQVYMRLLDDSVDLIEVLFACTQGRLDQVDLVWRSEKCACITLAAHGYPEDPRKGNLIEILGGLGTPDIVDPIVFHGATKWSARGLVTDGGRVLSVTRLIAAPEDLAWAYFPMTGHGISFEGMQYRKDIGKVC